MHTHTAPGQVCVDLADDDFEDSVSGWEIRAVCERDCNSVRYVIASAMVPLLSCSVLV